MTLYVTRWAGGDTALILIDVIKGFYEPGGEFYHPVYAQSLDAIAQLLVAARQNGRLVVHARETHLPGEPNFELLKLPDHAESGSFHQAFVPDFEPVGREIELNKRRYSAFFATDLALRLAEHGIKRVVLAGCKTNVCVRATAQDAFGYGLDVVIPREAVASNRPHLHAASLEDIDRYMGRVVTLEQAVELLRGEPIEPPAPEHLATDQGVRQP